MQTRNTYNIYKTANKNIGAGNDNPELYQYYYHSDHLGSASYITNLEGEIVQHIEYIPFGEVFIEEQNNVWNTPFLFNGKELDEETGLYYYGARYYNPRESVWLSVDPIALYNPIFEVEHYIDGQHNGGVFNEKNLNVYGYTYQNPVRFVDPTGMSAEEPETANDMWQKLLNEHNDNNACKDIGGTYGNDPQNGTSQNSNQQQPTTLQQQLESQLSKTKVGESISGKQLGEAIGNSDISYGVSKITRTDKSNFKISRTGPAAISGLIKKNASMKITKETLNSKPAFRIQIEGYSKTLINRGALPDFYIQGNNIYFYGKDGKLYRGSTGKE